MNPDEKKQRKAIRTRIVAPEVCSVEELQSFAQMVRHGDQVTRTGLESRIAAAAWLGFAWIGEEPRRRGRLEDSPAHVPKKVFSAASVEPLASHCHLEFGWVPVLPPFRGLGIAKTLLCELTAKHSGGIFATTSRRQSIHAKNPSTLRFRRSGPRFPKRSNGCKQFPVGETR